MTWKKEFPEEAGWYWFYGYQYGRYRGPTPEKPRLMLIEVRKVINGFMYVGNGAFMYKKEVEEPHFQKVILPELPRLED